MLKTVPVHFRNPTASLLKQDDTRGSAFCALIDCSHKTGCSSFEMVFSAKS